MWTWLTTGTRARRPASRKRRVATGGVWRCRTSARSRRSSHASRTRPSSRKSRSSRSRCVEKPSARTRARDGPSSGETKTQPGAACRAARASWSATTWPPAASPLVTEWTMRIRDSLSGRGTAARPYRCAMAARTRLVFVHSIGFFGSTEEGYLVPLLDGLDPERFEPALVVPAAPVLAPLFAHPALEGRVTRLTLLPGSSALERVAA